MPRRLFLSLATAVFLTAAGGARAQSPDWNAVAAEDTIEIVTHDADGALRETTVWLGVVDATGYVRTSDSRWSENIGRDPDVVVRIAGTDYPLRAESTTDPALRARVNEVFRAKYGFMDRMLSWFGNDGGKVCYALVPRPASP
jgi:hypothetical protein